METLEIASSPYEESCAQVGSPDYATRGRAECRALIEQLRRIHGPEPEGASLVVKANPHDFGTYYEVACRFDPDVKEAVDYAFRLEAETPARWDDDARRSLGLMTADQAVVWTCAGCKVELAHDLDAPGEYIWQNGERVHHAFGSAHRYGESHRDENPEPEAYFELEGARYCPGCAGYCGERGCTNVIFNRSELQGDTYAPGSSFPDIRDPYHSDPICVYCFEKIPTCVYCGEYDEETNEDGYCASCTEKQA